MHAGNNLRSSILYQTDILPQAAPVVGSSGMQGSVAGAGYPDSPSTQVKRRSQLSDSAAYGATGLKNFGNTCFMNCVIQCLVGTAPFARYFMQGGWKKDLVRSNGGKSDVAVEFARLVDNMWRGQYGSISPIGFRSSVAKCSEVFKGNDQEDAQEFATFLLDAIHESLNRVQKRRPSPAEEKQLSQEEEMQFEALPDAQQADIQWGKYIRRNWSIMTSIFQGQTQSRLTCMTCKHTSTTYDTFTELSVQIPTADTVRGGAAAAAGGGKTLVRKSAANISSSSSSSALNSGPFNIYQCLDAFSKAEILDGDDKWHCPKCKTRRRATKRLLVSRLPLVLIVHLKRFLTIGHFREKLENNILFPTRNLYMDRYTIPNVQQQQQTGGSTCYNLYGVANHFGTLSGGHYTASVFNGLRGQWNYFDDTRVSTIPEANVVTPAAYLLFFVQSQQ
ncbi:ubiquitin-specific protease doa4 [Coemansia sp. BCRC 34490]|nr:ubiquitin-specific protease doa4 [Coemansia sp. BCRC 34490]